MASLVTVHIYYDHTEAVIAKSVLDAYGLVAIIPDWHYLSMSWHHTFALQGIRLCTIDTELAEATALLTQSSPDETDPGIPSVSGIIIAIAIFWFFGFPHPVRRTPKTKQ